MSALRGGTLSVAVVPWTAEEIVERLRASGLRGRGGGWFPAARKWEAVRREAKDAPGPPPVLIANGAEGEPGSIKDRHVMTTRPADVLAGIAIAARAIGATQAIVYLKGSFARSAAALEATLAADPPEGLTVGIRLGADTYIGGEETAVLEFLEGRRPWPRPKPPLPFAVGLEQRPTLVQNVETLARVPAAVADPEAFRVSESTFVSLWGSIGRPGVYDVPLGTPLRRVIDDFGGGAPDGIRAIFPAGPSASPLTADQADTPLHPDALRAAGSALGTAAILVIGASTCPISVAASLAAFFEREACGQCPPCVVGTQNLARVVRSLAAGKARAADIGSLGEVAGFMAQHGYCAHGRTAAESVTGLLGRFKTDVEAHIAGGPRHGRHADPFGAGSPERTAIEAALPS
jgi:NADH:ubiquinone oxidoreductase subunit F (NADH-binding)